MKNLRVASLFAWFTLASCVSCAHSPPSWTKAVPTVLTDVKESLFAIVAGPQDHAGLGNAWMIGRGVLFTAGHVCAGKVNDNVFILKNKKVYGGMIVWKDFPDADVCIVESDVPGRPLVMQVDVPDYDHGYAVSYVPIGPENNPIQFKIFIREVRVRGELPAFLEHPPDGVGKRLFLDGQFQPGDSGSPLFNDEGYVIGLLSAVRKDNEDDTVGNGIAIVIDTRTIYAVYQNYLEAKKELIPIQLPLPPAPEFKSPPLGKDMK